jgi:hypothetical protein
MSFPNSGDGFNQPNFPTAQPLPGGAPMPQFNQPGAPGGLPKLGSLSSLAQTARMKHIKSAKTVLFIVGILTMGLSAVMFAIAEQTVQSQIDQELRGLGPGFIVDQQKMAELKIDAVAKTRLGAGIGFVEGLVFLLLGVFVQKAPVAMTATGLILYVADYAIGGAFDPTYLVKGIIVKIIIVVCLVKALKAAIAYERERKNAEATA